MNCRGVFKLPCGLNWSLNWYFAPGVLLAFLNTRELASEGSDSARSTCVMLIQVPPILTGTPA